MHLETCGKKLGIAAQAAFLPKSDGLSIPEIIQKVEGLGSASLGESIV